MNERFAPKPNTTLAPFAYLQDTSGMKFIIKSTEKSSLYFFALPKDYTFQYWFDKDIMQSAVFEHFYLLLPEKQDSFQYKNIKKHLLELVKELNDK